ncbi:MAG: hypothetical protein RQ856_06640, partial [Candidatus Izemoplasmatales bacterium]|nr:hypothetical protein [Candidatus Izemoplasmatales bacterium]
MPRLDYEDLLRIYKLISLDYKAYHISSIMHIHPSTLYRIIKSNIQVKTSKYNRSYRYKSCIHLSECRKQVKRCPDDCPRFE